MELSKKNWGNAMWKFLHVAAAFQEDTDAICDQIYLLCRVLPCPECRAHMTAHVQTNPPRELINSIEDAGAYLFTLHNSVNMLVTPPKALMSINEYEDRYGPINIARVPKELLDVTADTRDSVPSKKMTPSAYRNSADRLPSRQNVPAPPTRHRRERQAASTASQMRKGHTIMWKDPENQKGGGYATANTHQSLATQTMQNRSALYANNGQQMQHHHSIPAYRPRARFTNSLRMPTTSHL